MDHATHSTEFLAAPWPCPWCDRYHGTDESCDPAHRVLTDVERRRRLNGTITPDARRRAALA